MGILFAGGAILFAALFSIVSLAFYIFVIIDCAKYEPGEGNTKIAWILIIILTAPIGGIIFFMIRRPERISTLGQ